MNQCFWTNLLNEWFNDSLINTSLVSLLDESVFLNESLEWMIQWLTHKYFTCFITGWISVFWTNLLNEWFSDSLINTSLVSLLDESVFLNESLELMIQWLTHKYFTCFITGWISVFERISWINDSMSNTLLIVTCRYLLEKQCNWHKQFLKHQLLLNGDLLYLDRFHRHQCLYLNYKVVS